jgi:type IV secretion system protein VirD4
VLDRFAREMMESHLALEARPRSGVDAQAQLALSFAADPAVVRATTNSSFTAGDLVAGDRPGTVYLTMAVSSFDALHMYSRVLLQSVLLGLLHDQRMTSDGRRKRHRVLFVLDEFPALGALPFFEHAMATMAGAGIKALLVCQSLSQVAQAYGPEQSIIGNCGTQVLVPPFDDLTMRHATARCGTLIAHLRARHRKIGWLDRQSETSSQSRHPTLNQADSQLRMDEALVLPPAGLQPCWVRRNRWWENTRYQERIRS